MPVAAGTGAAASSGWPSGPAGPGPAGGAAAWLGFTLPSAIVLTILGLLANTVDVAGAGWVHGLKLAAVAIVAQALYGMARTLATDLPRRIIAVAAAPWWHSPGRRRSPRSR